MNGPPPTTSILIPHYRTPVHLAICLRLLRAFTPAECETIVIDNGTPDEALRGIPELMDETVRLIRRDQGGIERHPQEMAAHASALDAGMEASAGRRIVALHSDTFVRRPDWLEFLEETLEAGPFEMAGPGSHKLVPPSLWRRLTGNGKETATAIRPVFTLYRRTVFDDARFGDFPDVGDISVPYVEEGRAAIIPAVQAAQYAFHTGGTTRLVQFRHRRTAMRKKARQLRKFLNQTRIKKVVGERMIEKLPY